MKKKPSQDKQLQGPQPQHVLGKVPGGDFARELEPTPQSTGEAQPSPPPAENKLELPDHALVAMRKSGGLRFTSVEVIVHVDGTVTVEGGAIPGVPIATPARKLRDEELAALYRALSEANLQELPARSGVQNPDAYVYEIVARTASGTYAAELSDGSIPTPLVPLIRLLAQYTARQ